MARGPSVRVVINREALDRAVLAVADGFAEAGQLAVDAAEPPDAAPFGKGLPASGGTLTYVNGKKVAGYGLDGKQPKKPRAVRVRDAGLLTIVGFGFPARFQEFGTVHHGAQPFLTPNMIAIKGEVPGIVRQHAAKVR